MHRLRCPYCRYNTFHSMASWNALTQAERTAIVARRRCKH